ncbi:hypothetical protein IAG44_12605 [Streptomyces roseirectus]|uniref:Uncharacterized protein n=1 Tax=Streptomyces roseirectus TaxID=2768066 RepID=A0A7H0IBP0_9ACTN|nr:hypothetical protein [Streptomyces roseirectus]QNP70206.1 hypothetical protein IAG44_12605 [Streptomyces roseirectus]
MSELSRQPRILLVGPSVEVVRAAGAAGFGVWSLWDARRCPDARLAVVSERLLLADFADEAGLADATGAAAEAGLCVNPPGAVRLLADKEAVRRVGEVNGLVATGSSGAVGGARFRVDTLSVHGMHHTVGITVETPYGVLYPAPVTAGVAAALRSAVASLLDLAGYQYGPACTSVVLTARGPVTTGCRTVVAEEPVAGLVRVAAGRDVVGDAFGALAGRDVVPVRARGFAVAIAVGGLLGERVRELPYVREVVGGYAVVGAESVDLVVELAGFIRELAGSGVC